MTPMRSIIPVFVPHTGCPFDCAFCNQRSISGKTSTPSPESVRDEICEALAKIGQRSCEVAFYGGSFTGIEPGLRRAYLETVQPFLRAGEVESVRVSTRPDYITQDILEEIYRYGVRTVELGAQSMDDGVLEASGRGHTAGQTQAASALIKSCGMALILQMMVGLPGDTREKSLDTARTLIGLQPDGMRIYPTVVLRGTRLAEMYECGNYKPPGIDSAVEICADLIELCVGADIPIIRIGLNANEGLTRDGEALAGAYHPALGELAYAEFYYRLAAKALEKFEQPGNPVIYVPQRRVSAMAGHRGLNKERLRAEFGLKQIKITPADMPDCTLRIYFSAKDIHG